MLPDFRAAGAALVSICPQLPEFVRAWRDEDGITFDVIPDPGNGVARSYGLTFTLPEDLRNVYRDALKIDLARFNGDETWELAMPASYVVGTDGVIAYAFVDPDYTVRPEPAELLEVVHALRGPGGGRDRHSGHD